MKRATTLLLMIILIELSLGGGGRLTSYGPISLRMIFFVMAIAATGIFFYRRHTLPATYWRLILLFTGILILAAVRGLVAGAAWPLWWEDVKPLLYFFILPFFYFACSGKQEVSAGANIIRASGVILAIAFFIVLLFIYTTVPFLSFYRTAIGTGEFFFRGELTFFYKGFLFFGLSFLFIHFSAVRYKWVLMALLLLAIILSVTRGLLFALSATYAIYYFPRLQRKKTFLFVLLALVVLLGGNLIIRSGSKLLATWSSPPGSARDEIYNSQLLGDRNYSDSGRLQQIKEVVQAMTPVSVLAGHGFGMGTPSRPVHMEIAYLEIFHKQGLAGLLFWIFLIYTLFKKYKAAERGMLRESFFYGSLFIFLQSLTNQYVNNPIGLSIVLLSLVSLDRLRKPDPA